MDELSFPEAGVALGKITVPMEQGREALSRQRAQTPSVNSDSRLGGAARVNRPRDHREDPSIAPTLRLRAEDAAGGRVHRRLLRELVPLVLRSASIPPFVAGLRGGGRVTRSYR
ncbi:uncharacterized protein LOC143153106 [Ptiloglossa arizonensis]|uniref:uncharacterized protein LOC143153106 n=1 Tax=Ptiloglossa arizonensis TaxID=3350558 RepID=UPI003FA06D89